MFETKFDEKYLKIWDHEEIENYQERMERCVNQGDVEGFRELIIPYGQLIQDLTLALL